MQLETKATAHLRARRTPLARKEWWWISKLRPSRAQLSMQPPIGRLLPQTTSRIVEVNSKKLPSRCSTSEL